MLKVLRKASICQYCLTSNVKKINVLTVPMRNKYYWQQHFEGEMYERRLAAGPEPERPRSAWNWNYESELFCFGKRLGEQFREKTLRAAFTHKSYVESQTDEFNAQISDGQQSLPISDDDNNLIPAPPATDVTQDNTELIQRGGQIIDEYTLAWLRYHFPRMPEECIRNIHAYLTTVEMLSYIGLNLGVKDLILAMDFPPTEETLANTLKAVIGALAHDQSEARAQRFVQHFILTQLVGKDINQFLQIDDPMSLLTLILNMQGLGTPEPRLIHQSGASTLLSVYMVGIYVDKKLMGKNFGESPTIAEEMAARDVLRTMFETTQHRTPLIFKEELELPERCFQENYRLPEYFDRYHSLSDSQTDEDRLLASS